MKFVSAEFPLNEPKIVGVFPLCSSIDHIDSCVEGVSTVRIEHWLLKQKDIDNCPHLQTAQNNGYTFKLVRWD